ncbi:MAG: energy transducer TonB [Alteromonadaceae bacterium]|nr:energy transducer TonB [Alteromonadaceae bacterium]
MNKFLVALSILSTTLISNTAVAAELSKHLYTTSDPVPIKRVSPRYPINAAKYRREGWAKLSFVIEKDGSVSNVLVTETSGSRDFANAAKSAVLKWQYKPAFENGEPIQQCVNTIQMEFSMKKGGETGVTRRFMSKYKKSLAALKNQDFKQVEQLLAEFSKFKKMHLSESNYLHLLGANYAKAISDKELELFHLNRIRFSTGKAFSGKEQLGTLNDILQLEISLNKIRSAVKTYKRIIKLEAAKPYLKKFENIMIQLDEYIRNDKYVTIKADIKNNGYWHANLIRNEFSLTNIEGSLHKLDVRCANKRHVYTVKENSTWKLPTSWKKCSIYIYGEDNTTFNLVEHPLKS